MDTTVTTDRASVLSTIRDVLTAVVGRELPPIDEGTALLDGLGLDSTRVLELLMELEDSLGLEFDIDSLEQRDVETVGSLADYVQATQALCVSFVRCRRPGPYGARPAAAAPDGQARLHGC